MRVRLKKLAGDSNEGDYCPTSMWVHGHMQDYPEKGKDFWVKNIFKSYDECDGALDFVLMAPTHTFDTLNGLLLISRGELWALTFL